MTCSFFKKGKNKKNIFKNRRKKFSIITDNLCIRVEMTAYCDCDHGFDSQFITTQSKYIYEHIFL